MTNLTRVDKDEPFYAGQTRILEMVASGAPLSDILTSIVLLMEAQADGMHCSILVLHADGKRVQHGAAPSLPEAYVKAVNGAPIGWRNGRAAQQCSKKARSGNSFRAHASRRDCNW